MSRSTLLSFVTARGWVLFVLVVTLMAKLVVIQRVGPQFDLHSDDRSYLVTAELLLKKGTFTYNDPNNPTLFIMPAYPAMLASVMAVTGPGARMEQAIRGLQAAIVAIGLWILFLVGKRIFTDLGAALGVTLAAFYPPLWVMSNFILTEALFFLAIAALVLAGLRLGERGTPASAALFGVAWLAGVYVRPTIALWPGVLFLLLLLWRSMPAKRLLQCGAVAGVVFVLGMSPWWWRNYVAIGEFVPLTRSSGGPLWLGTYVDGEQPSLKDQVAYHKPYPTLLEQDAFDRAWGLQRIKEGFRSEPLKWIRWYTVGKFVKFWGAPYYWIALPRVSLSLAESYHEMLLVLGVTSLWVTRRSRPAWVVFSLLAYMSVLHMVFLAHSRYSAPVMPFLALLAGNLVAVLWSITPAARDLQVTAESGQMPAGRSIVRHSAPSEEPGGVVKQV
jgi:hypothetical protein